MLKNNPLHDYSEQRRVTPVPCMYTCTCLFKMLCNVGASRHLGLFEGKERATHGENDPRTYSHACMSMVPMLMVSSLKNGSVASKFALDGLRASFDVAFLVIMLNTR
eukprot:m.977169 g.977169  ORF g.977169 m.977169 type:complete len:107 (-) comp23950_c1_seq4:1828-2148(-)